MWYFEIETHNYKIFIPSTVMFVVRSVKLVANHYLEFWIGQPLTVFFVAEISWKISLLCWKLPLSCWHYALCFSALLCPKLCLHKWCKPNTHRYTTYTHTYTQTHRHRHTQTHTTHTGNTHTGTLHIWSNYVRKLQSLASYVDVVYKPCTIQNIVVSILDTVKWCNIRHCGVLIIVLLWWSALSQCHITHHALWYAHCILYSTISEWYS